MNRWRYMRFIWRDLKILRHNLRWKDKCGVWIVYLGVFSRNPMQWHHKQPSLWWKPSHQCPRLVINFFCLFFRSVNSSEHCLMFERSYHLIFYIVFYWFIFVFLFPPEICQQLCVPNKAGLFMQLLALVLVSKYSRIF